MTSVALGFHLNILFLQFSLVLFISTKCKYTKSETNNDVMMVRIKAESKGIMRSSTRNKGN